MARVITFSKYFPAYHLKKGQETFFVEKFLSGDKKHTIRAGSRWNTGDIFSPRYWTGKPYNSKQEQFAPDTEILKVYSFEINEGCFMINNELYAYSSSVELLDKLAENDGLSQIELLEWFRYPKDFKGQIICWREVNY